MAPEMADNENAISRRVSESCNLLPGHLWWRTAPLDMNKRSPTLSHNVMERVSGRLDFNCWFETMSRPKTQYDCWSCCFQASQVYAWVDEASHDAVWIGLKWPVPGGNQVSHQGAWCACCETVLGDWSHTYAYDTAIQDTSWIYRVSEKLVCCLSSNV